jgi:hypothetical protein
VEIKLWRDKSRAITSTGKAGLGFLTLRVVHELAPNPDNFTGRTDEMILSTLVHEMCHVWQQTHGKAPRRGSHDRQWAGKMREVGLQPSTTDEEGGKETGQAVSHYIILEGRFAKAYAKLAATGFQLHWQFIPATKQGRAKKSSKTKFTCPDCGQNALAKPDALLICGECFDEGEGDICFMLAEQEM